MSWSNKKFFIYIRISFLYSCFFIWLITGCSNNEEQAPVKIEEQAPEKVLLKYKDGTTFCEGTHRVYKKWLKTKKNRIGFWKFYFPNGKLESISEYDNEGEYLNYKLYNIDNQLIYSWNNSKETIITIEYFVNGNIKNESIVKIEFDDGYETYYETLREYYINGQISVKKEFIDDVLQGSAKIWNKDGELILEYEYQDGLIKVDNNDNNP